MDPMMSALVRFARRMAPPGMGDGELGPEGLAALRAGYASALALSGMRAEPGVVVEAFAIPGLAPGRSYVPKDAVGTLLYFHGGGFIMGSAATHDGLCGRLAAAAGVRVVSAEYRLAPEHPFPAAHDDAAAALAYVQAGCVGPLLVGGDSAGANLAASLARDGGVAGQVLLYPIVDMVRSPGRYPSLDVFADGFLLTAEGMNACGRALMSPGQDPAEDRLSPIGAALGQAAPAVVAVAGFDPLRDQGRAYAAALRAAGRRVEVLEEPGLVHGFADFAGVVPAARRAVDRVAAAVRRLVADAVV